MRITCCIIVLSLFVLRSQSQSRLSDSRTSGPLTQIYRITDAETEELIKNPKAVTDDFFHSLEDSYSDGVKSKVLTYGNFLQVRVVKNKMEYDLITNNNVSLSFINNLKDFQFTITDHFGNIISDAKVYAGRGKPIHYNKNSHLYQTGYPKKDGFIKVIHNGISNYFTYEVQEFYNRNNGQSLWRKAHNVFPVKQIKRIFFKRNYRQRKISTTYKSFLVFSKPKYKPYDTVKFKAYVLTSDGKNIANKKLNVILTGNDGDKKLTRLQPYSPGAYEYQFVLADSLNLRLDANYNIRLIDSLKNGEQEITSGSFRYEDYELKSLNFNVRSDNPTHYPGHPISIFMKATDENELSVADARVEIVARTQNVFKFYSDSVFVKDTLWRKNINLDPVGETKLVLPDSIFPDASLSFALDIRMLSSSNEIRTVNQYLKFDAKKANAEKKVVAKFVKDSLIFGYTEARIEKPQSAWIYKKAANGVAVDSQKVQLPVSVFVDHRIIEYQIVLANGVDTIVRLFDFQSDVLAVAMQKEKTLALTVVNPHRIPFWYTVFSGNKVLLKGYANALDTVIKHSSKRAAHFRINYLWDEEEKTTEVSTFYNERYLSIKLLTPDVVYPGQKVNMKVRVLDTKENPVSEADVTAYAHTSKFNSNTPSIPRFGKVFYQRKTKPVEFESDDVYASNGLTINWNRWAKALALDTIEYYRFTHPRQLYITVEAAKDSITQFAPFVMKGGEIEPVSIIYVDELPVFYYNSQQLQTYAFDITPGRHSIRLRTPNYDVWLRDVLFRKGVKTIFSVLADTTNKQALVVKKKNVLSNAEAERLNRYMIRVMDNFEEAKTFIHDDSVQLWLNPPPMLGSQGHDRLIGPLKNNLLYFKSAGIQESFFKEPGYTYTFLPGLIKQKSYKGLYAFDTRLSDSYALADKYQQQVLTKADYDSIWNEFLNLRSYTTSLFKNSLDHDTATGRLQYKLDTAFTNTLPYIKNILIGNPANPQNLLVLNGNCQQLPALPAGSYTILFLLRDNRYFKAEHVAVKPGGVNFYHWGRFKTIEADQFSNTLDSSIKATNGLKSRWHTSDVPKEIVRHFNNNGFDFSTLKNSMTGRIVDGSTRRPIAGASVAIEALAVGVVTDENGFFKLNVPLKGKIKVSMAGYLEEVVNASNGNAGDIELESAAGQLEEVVVVGFGVQRKRSLMGSVTSIKKEDNLLNALQGRVAGLSVQEANIMMTGTVTGSAKPLIIVDGIPFDGDLGTLSPDDIESMNVLKETDATGIYGSKGANGVIIIKTKMGNTIINEAGAIVPGEQRLRTRFSDEGFWQPRLITNERGEASFTVTFPDDITNWQTRVIAINGKKQSGLLETSIKSFKTLSANFVSPLFAIEGDSMNVIGKLMNYTSMPERLLRVLKYNNQTMLKDSLTITNAHIDSTPIAVKGMDSLSFEYTLQQANGYFDGELRKLPVYAAGVKETIGQFFYLDKDSVADYIFSKDKGVGTVRAEASVFPVLLDEMRQLRDYEYLCNEQLASKLKSLLMEKKLRSYLQDSFKYEKHILSVIKKLNENKTMQNLWGWWPGAQEETWISLHVVEALLQAEAQGYKTQLNKELLYRYLLGKVADAGGRADAKMIRMLQVLDGPQNIKDWVQEKEADTLYQKQKKTLYEWLQIMQLKQLAGLPVNVDSLMILKKTTMFGGLYWGEDRYQFWDNSIQNTLLAYSILKVNGGHENELAKMRQYFMEQRRDGQWRNTYESSLILETILPDLFIKRLKPTPATLVVNGEEIKNFPFEKTFEAGEKVSVQKLGDMPVYFTAYQQYQNPRPQKISKDFDVTSYFLQDGSQAAFLKAASPTILRVEVEARADAEYVMVEVPIPAGCSYERKPQSFWGVETHREYFKNKTSIFCTKLKQGKYVFDIELMPRYNGKYILNPAKAEMMYFPVFYGREAIKTIGIK